MFQLFDQSIEIQESYSYLGLTFIYNGSYATAKKKKTFKRTSTESTI